MLRLLQAITTAYHDAAEHLAGELAGLVLEAANSGAPGDEIAVISDFGREVSSLLHATRGLGEAKFLHAIIIDDAIHSKQKLSPRCRLRHEYRTRRKVHNAWPTQGRMAFPWRPHVSF